MADGPLRCVPHVSHAFYFLERTGILVATPIMDSTLAKGLAVLEWLTRQRRESGVSDAARALGLARSNAHRTLQTLVACGFAEQNAETSAYRPSLRLFELGMLVGAAVDVAARLRPRLAALAAASGETIHLARLDGAEVVYLDKFDSPLPVAAYSRVGGRAPACCVASGKALLAAMRPDEAALRRRFGELRAHTPNSITTFDRLHGEVLRTAARGYAENREEWRLGVCGLGVPVFDARGEALVAVGMSVPSIRFGRVQAKALAARLLECARDASTSLGYRPGPASDHDDKARPAGRLSRRRIA
jgi:IclR family KDG regulon transcriptional repressor